MRPPEMRRRMVALKRSVLNSFRYDSEKAKLLADAFTTFVPLPMTPPWSEVSDLKDLDRQQRLVPGAVFVRNPWDGRYVEAGEIYEKFQLAKYNKIAHVCRALGAELLETGEMQAIVEGVETPIKIELGRPLDQDARILLGRAGVNTQAIERIRSQLRQKYKWDGGLPDPAKVEYWLKDTGLDADPAIQGLKEQRLIDGGALREYTLVASVSKEARRDISFVAELGTLLAKLLGSEFNFEIGRAKQTSFDVQVVLHVKFPRIGVRAR